MKELLRKVEKELENIGEKGLTSANLETAYKLMDIYKDAKESCYYEQMIEGGDTFDARGRARDSRGRYMDGNYDRGGYWEATGNYGHGPMGERTERYMRRMREGMSDYDEGRTRYRDGSSDDRMIQGLEMTMGAIVNFVESVIDYAETSREKEVVRKYIDKLKKI